MSGNAAVGDRGAALLFDAVASNGFLESLGVAACGLGEAAFVKAAEMMGRNAGLRRLSLAGNRGASAKAMHALGEALKESPIEELSLAETGLRLEGMEALAAALAASPALTSLDVSRNGLVGGSFDPLTPVLPRCAPELRRLFHRQPTAGWTAGCLVCFLCRELLLWR